MYFVVKETGIEIKKELSFAELRQLVSGELRAVNMTDMMVYNHETTSWDKIKPDTTDQKGVGSTDLTIDGKAFLTISAAATRMFLDKAMPKGLSAREIQGYILFSALREFLLQNGVDPKFRLGKW